MLRSISVALSADSPDAASNLVIDLSGNENRNVRISANGSMLTLRDDSLTSVDWIGIHAADAPQLEEFGFSVDMTELEGSIIV